jgi:hypothetical protein
MKMMAREKNSLATFRRYILQEKTAAQLDENKIG